MGEYTSSIKNPKISVIFSAYNAEMYLKEAVESVLSQSYSDFEFIIVNDGSRDNTEKILNEYTDSRIKRIYNRQNIGLVKSLNIALKDAQGELIARMDADDISSPDRFEKQVAYLDTEPDVSVLGTNMKQIDAAGKTIGILKVPSSHELIKWKMLFETSMFHPTVMMRKDVLLEVGNYNSAYQHIEDTELWSRLIERTRFSNLNKVLYTRRWHDRSICNIHHSIQFTKGVDIRQNLFENILETNIPTEIILLFSQCLHSFQQRLDKKKVREICSLLLETWVSFSGKNQIDGHIAEEIRVDLVKRIIYISQKEQSLLSQNNILNSIAKLVPSRIQIMLRNHLSS